MQQRDNIFIIYVFFGLIASGKSTLASAWAKQHGLTYYNSDIIRKEIAGTSGTDGGFAFQQGIYAEEFTKKTYQGLVDKAVFEVTRGRSVILDASYRNRADRNSLRHMAKKHGAQVRFILCSCPEAELRRRMDERALDPHAVSDGRWEIYLHQKEVFEDPDELTVGELLTIQTVAPVNELIDELSRMLISN